MHRRFRVLASAALFAATLLTPGASAPARAGYPGANGLIVASSYAFDDGNHVNLILMTAAGEVDPTPLTNSPYLDLDGTWSPGGTRIVFTRYTASLQDGEIWVINADRTGLTRLTTNTFDDYYPSWAPDASRIVFSSNRIGGDYEIFSMTPTGGNVTRLTTSPGLDVEPAWSPDGKKIAFISTRNGSREVHVMNPDGTGVTRLTNTSAGHIFDFYPQWNADWIYFQRQTEPPASSQVDSEIYRIASSGASLADLASKSGAFDEYPATSPDGLKLLFDSNMDDPDPSDNIPMFELYTSNSVGDGITRLTFLGQSQAFDGNWQPIPAFPLVDARFSLFNLDIQWLYQEGITGGCGPERFCPFDVVLREQMASFLARALDLPSTSTDYFTDDETSIHEADINRLAAAGITTGCDASKFCPKDPVRRDQMASFLVRAYNLPTTTTDYFTDDEGNLHEPAINRLAASDVTRGCTTTTYCPTLLVTRDQMAAFLHRGAQT